MTARSALTRLSLLVALASCAHAGPSSPPVDRSPKPGEPTALTTTQSAEVSTVRGAPARLEFTETEGASASNLQTMFGAAAESLHRCIPGRSSGKLVLRVTSRDGVLHVSALPGISLDATTQACAHEALSSVYLPATASSTTNGAAIPPSGFTSLVTVAW